MKAARSVVAAAGPYYCTSVLASEHLHNHRNGYFWYHLYFSRMFTDKLKTLVDAQCGTHQIWLGLSFVRLCESARNLVGTYCWQFNTRSPYH